MNYWTTRTNDWVEQIQMNLVKQKQWLKIAAKLDLSDRELDVVKLLFAQMTRDQIAKSLGIKTRTVRQHMENIHDKLQVRTRVGVVLRVIQVRDLLAKEN